MTNPSNINGGTPKPLSRKYNTILIFYILLHAPSMDNGSGGRPSRDLSLEVTGWRKGTKSGRSIFRLRMNNLNIIYSCKIRVL